MKIKDATAQYKAMATATTAVSTLLLGSLSYALLLPDVNEANAETNVSVGTSGYTLAVSSSTSGKVNMSLNPTASGVFTMTKETLNTRTNAEGFSMYIGMQGDTNDLYLNGDTSSTALPATSSSASYTTPSAIGTNSWGYAIPQSSTMPIDGGTLTNSNLASGNGFSAGSYVDNSMEESNTKWAAVPVKGSEQIIQSTNTANNTDGVNLHVFYATKVNSSQVAGNYKGTVVYTAVAKSNSALIASSSPSTTKKLDGGETLTIVIGVNTNYSNLTTKTVTISDINGSDTCTITGGGNNPDGTLYLTCTTPAKPQSGFYDINIDLGSYGTYIIADGIEYIYKAYMQSITSLECTTTPQTVYDNRDENAYTVAKLADGKCWMLDNLALDLTDSTILNAMSEDNTNASNTTLGYLKGTTTRDVATDPNGNYAIASVSNWTQSSTYSYSEPWVNLTNKDVIPTDATSTAGNYKIGGYYNYCAASAGSYCYGDGQSEGTSSGDATEDICPKGWRLPTGGSSGEFVALANVIFGSGFTTDPTAYANYRAALHLPLSGYYNATQGSHGRWFTSTRPTGIHSSDNSMYAMDISSSNTSVSSSSIIDRTSGMSIRCVADN